ncbi:MAG: cohesin domain-containing protein [Candidatus Omnitrophota bacterium]
MKKCKIGKVSFIALFIIGMFLCCFPAQSFANIISMYMEQDLTTVGVGDIFSVDVCLDNSSATVFDSVMMWIAFNPAVLEVQDSDAGAEGIQILSDPLSIYNFNYHGSNIANNGIINFQESFLGNPSNASGVFARIDFKALALTEITNIDFNFNEWGFTPTTAVIYGGNDVLALSLNHADGAFGAGVQVVPEPSSTALLLLGAGLFFKKRLL